MAGSKIKVTPGYPEIWTFGPRTFGGRGIEIGRISDVDGTWSFSSAANFAGGLNKGGAPVLAGNPFLVVTQDGNNGAGSLALAGALVGDKVMSVTGLTTPADLSASFESTITVAGHIQQSSATDLSAKVCQFVLIHQS